MLRYDGVDLHPGSGGVQFGLGPLILSRGPEDVPVVYVPSAEATRLCGRTLDWIEALGPLRGASGADACHGGGMGQEGGVFVSRQLGHANPNIAWHLRPPLRPRRPHRHRTRRTRRH